MDMYDIFEETVDKSIKALANKVENLGEDEFAIDLLSGMLEDIFNGQQESNCKDLRKKLVSAVLHIEPEDDSFDMIKVFADSVLYCEVDLKRVELIDRNDKKVCDYDVVNYED